MCDEKINTIKNSLWNLVPIFQKDKKADTGAKTVSY